MSIFLRKEMINYLFHTALEEELESGTCLGFTKPIPFLMQYLPALFCRPDEKILVSKLPNKDALLSLEKQRGFIPEFVLHKSYSHDTEVSIWGESTWTRKFLRNHVMSTSQKLLTGICSKHMLQQWTEVQIKQVISHTEKETISTLANKKVVLKRALANSGFGIHFWNPGDEIPTRFIKRAHQYGLPLIIQPYHEKILEFSSQWKITSKDNISLLGVTRFSSSRGGSYESTLVAPRKLLFPGFQEFVEEHVNLARESVERIAKSGYLGHIGIDAMIIKQDGKAALIPILEINARKTMSYIAIQIHQAREEPIKLSIKAPTNTCQLYLPKEMHESKNGKTVCVDLLEFDTPLTEN